MGFKKKKQNIPSEIEHLEDVVNTISEQKANLKEQSNEKKEEKPKETRKERRIRKRAEKKLRKKSKKLIIPKTVQESIPYRCIYPDTGIIETDPGVFCKIYKLQDINFEVATDEDQVDMFKAWGVFLNSIPNQSAMQIVVHQQQRNLEDFKRTALIELKGDRLDALRQEQNDLRLKDIQRGKNSLAQYKYIVIKTPASSYEAVVPMYSRIDAETVALIKAVGDAFVEPLPAGKVLEVLHDIYNPNQVGLFGNAPEINPQTGEVHFSAEKFSFRDMQTMGLSTKDTVGPDSLYFDDNYGKVGDVYFRALYIQNYSRRGDVRFLKVLSDVDCKMVTSITFEPIPMETALKIIKTASNNTRSNVIEKQKQASKSGYSPDLIAPDIQEESAEYLALRDALTNDNQKMFFVTTVIVHFADTLDQLNLDTAAIQSVGRSRMMEIKPLTYQMEKSLNACLPLCQNKLDIKRCFITECASLLFPFCTQELYDENGGIYYGLNKTSNNLILVNRLNSDNSNGIIVGASGKGKSMMAKSEIIRKYISSTDQIIIIDPDGEYARLANILGGEVIHVSPSSSAHINLFDIDMLATKDGEKPLAEKTNFIITIFDTILTASGQYPLTPQQRSVLDRCIGKAYNLFLDSRDESGNYDDSKLPTLKDLYEILRLEDGYEAMSLADIIEMYATGSQNMFAHHTNVSYHSRLVVYDIKDMGEAMKVLGELVVLNNVWTEITKGRKEGRNVWFYIDEMHLLFKNASSVNFLSNLYKRARKYGGIPTGITQNISDLLQIDEARNLIKNSEFVIMLDQSADDREALQELLHIPPALMNNITNAPPGHGLIRCGASVVPFVNDIPKETLLYRASTTKLSEVKTLDDIIGGKDVQREANDADVK